MHGCEITSGLAGGGRGDVSSPSRRRGRPFVIPADKGAWGTCRPHCCGLRRDLRLHDLPALLEAAAGGAEVLACFVLDPRLEKSSGPRRMQFLGDSLRALSEALDGRLLITRGRA